MHEQPFKPNWLLIMSTIVFLIIIGWLLGLLTSAPNGQTIHCTTDEVVLTLPSKEGGEIAYCEPRATN